MPEMKGKVSRTYDLEPETVKLLGKIKKKASYASLNATVEAAIIQLGYLHGVT